MPDPVLQRRLFTHEAGPAHVCVHVCVAVEDYIVMFLLEDFMQ